MSRKGRLLIAGLLSIAFHLCVVMFADTASVVRLAWNPSNDPRVNGYFLYLGATSGHYDYKADVGNATESPVDQADGIYYAAASAYVSLGSNQKLESKLSNEVRFAIVSPTPNPNETPTPTPSTPIPTPGTTATPTPSPAPEVTPEPIPVPTATPSPSPIETSSPEPTDSPTPTPAPTPVDATPTPTATATPAPEPTASPTPVVTPTATPTPTASPSPCKPPHKRRWYRRRHLAYPCD
jgi:hypothetical protein